MTDTRKPSNCSCNIMLWFNNFLGVLSLRQGTILIAVHQIALSSFILVFLLVGISHVGEMLSILHSDMEDDAERRGFYDVTYGDQLLFHEGEGISTNNQKRFANAQYLASMTVILLYTVTILTALYVICSISLLYGAIKYKREYVVPWVGAACLALILLMVTIVICDKYETIIKLCGGHISYHLNSIILVLTFLYAILVVMSFSSELEANERCGAREVPGERLLLLDHVAHSNLLSTAQLDKLTKMNQTQFV